MSGAPGETQDHHVDALGTRHDASSDSIEAIRRAIGDRDADGSRDVIVLSEGEEWRVAPSRILTATLDDVMAVEERPNMPAMSREWPNWSVTLPEPIETLEKSTVAARIVRVAEGRALWPIIMV